MIEDGELTTPVHMTPVVCMPVLETNSLPGTGWAISKWGRNYYDQVANIHRLLDGLAPLKMRPWTPNWHGEVIEIDGIEWSAGSCYYDARTCVVTITELPYGVKNKTYIYGPEKSGAAADDDDDTASGACLAELKHVKADTIRDESEPAKIHITFELYPGAIDEIDASYGSAHFTPLQDYLGLSKHMGAMLNFIDDDGCVRSFSTYEGAMIPWFRERLRLYPLRFEREIILIDLRIKMLSEQLRYLGERRGGADGVGGGLGLTKVKRVRQAEILAEHGYIRFNVARLNHPEVPNGQIADVVLGSRQTGDGAATYSYLLGMSDADGAEEAIDKLTAEIAALEMRKAELSQPGIVKKVWREEIAEVTKFVDAAMADGWVPKRKVKYASA